MRVCLVVVFSLWKGMQPFNGVQQHFQCERRLPFGSHLRRMFNGGGSQPDTYWPKKIHSDGVRIAWILILQQNLCVAFQAREGERDTPS